MKNLKDTKNQKYFKKTLKIIKINLFLKIDNYTVCSYQNKNGEETEV